MSEFTYSKRRSINFYIILIIHAFFLYLVLKRGYALYLKPDLLKAYVYLGLSVLGYMSVLSIAFFKKWAVFLLGLVLVGDYMAEAIFFSGTQNNDSAFALFVYTLSWAIWYPRWSQFK